MPDSIVSTSKLRLISKNFQKNAALSLLYCFFFFLFFGRVVLWFWWFSCIFVYVKGTTDLKGWEPK